MGVAPRFSGAIAMFCRLWLLMTCIIGRLPPHITFGRHMAALVSVIRTAILTPLLLAGIILGASFPPTKSVIVTVVYMTMVTTVVVRHYYSCSPYYGTVMALLGATVNLMTRYATPLNFLRPPVSPTSLLMCVRRSTIFRRSIIE